MAPKKPEDQQRYRYRRGSTVSATEAQNNFGRVLRDAAREGVVYITKYDQPTAVVMSMDAFARLSPSEDVDLEQLEREFDRLVAGMQTPEAEEAADRFFRMGGEELGEAARRAAREYRE